MNLALPAIRAQLGGGIPGSQWIVDAYNVTFAALLLTAGTLGDRFGRRRRLLLMNSLAFQQLRGMSPLLTALWFLPMPVTYLALIPQANSLAARTGPRLPMVTGLALMGRPCWSTRASAQARDCGSSSSRSLRRVQGWPSTPGRRWRWRWGRCRRTGRGWPPAW